MSGMSATIVEGYRYTGDDLDLSGTDLWCTHRDNGQSEKQI